MNVSNEYRGTESADSALNRCGFFEFYVGDKSNRFHRDAIGDLGAFRNKGKTHARTADFSKRFSDDAGVVFVHPLDGHRIDHADDEARSEVAHEGRGPETTCENCSC